jgi:hypothetical protein
VMVYDEQGQLLQVLPAIHLVSGYAQSATTTPCQRFSSVCT